MPQDLLGVSPDRETDAPIPEQEYWVIGGEYRDISFRELRSDAEAFGPYDSHDQALRIWRARNEASKSAGLVRYRIAVNSRCC
jgi:hypothetical protein